MSVKLINKENGKLYLTDFFNEKDLYSDSLNDFNKKIRKDLKEKSNILKQMLENQKRFGELTIHDLGIEKWKDLIDFDNLKRTIGYLNNNQFIEQKELEQVEKSDIINSDKGVKYLFRILRNSLSICSALNADKKAIFDMKDYNKGTTVGIKQFSIINKNTETDLYDLSELSEMYFNEIYGITKDGENLYNFSPNKFISVSYYLDKESFLIEIIDYNGNKKDNIIIEKSDLIEFTGVDYQEDVSIKQIFVNINEIDNFNLENFLSLDNNEVIIDDETIINKISDELRLGWLGYNYNYNEFENLLRIDKAVKVFLDGQGLEYLRFDIDDVLDIETAFGGDLENLKKDLKKVIRNISLKGKEDIFLSSVAEVEWLYNSKNIIDDLREKISDINLLYEKMVTQILIHYIIFYLFRKVNHIVDVINKDTLYDFLQEFEMLYIILKIKQNEFEQSIKVSIK